MVLGWVPTMGLEYTAKNCDQENSCVLYRFFFGGRVSIGHGDLHRTDERV